MTPLLLKLKFIVAIVLLSSCIAVFSEGDINAGEQKAELCIRCHGTGGRSTIETIPKLSGQRKDYIVRSAVEFQNGIRTDPLMSVISHEVENVQDLEDIAAFFASQTPEQNHGTVSELGKQGEALYVSKRCAFCHEEGDTGNAPLLSTVAIIGGQHKTYLIKAMTDIRDGERPGDIYNLMKRTLAEMSDKQIEAIAEYLSGLPLL